RSSSMREPRYPLPRVVFVFCIARGRGRSVARPPGAPFVPRFLGATCAGGWFVRRRGPYLGRSGPAPTGRGEGRPRPGPPPSRPVFETRSRVVPSGQVSTMILPQVHLRKPCYDFSFL